MLSRMVLLALTGFGLSGCIIIPTPSHGGVGVITEETIEPFEPGKTTRADVLLRLGNPAERLEEDRFFVYHWIRIHGYFAAGGATRASCFLSLLSIPWASSSRLITG